MLIYSGLPPKMGLGRVEPWDEMNIRESDGYPLVNVYVTMENHERSTIFHGKIHYKSSFSIVFCMFTRPGSDFAARAPAFKRPTTSRRYGLEKTERCRKSMKVPQEERLSNIGILFCLWTPETPHFF